MVNWLNRINLLNLHLKNIKINIKKNQIKKLTIIKKYNFLSKSKLNLIKIKKKCLKKMPKDSKKTKKSKGEISLDCTINLHKRCHGI